MLDLRFILAFLFHHAEHLRRRELSKFRRRRVNVRMGHGPATDGRGIVHGERTVLTTVKQLMHERVGIGHQVVRSTQFRDVRKEVGTVKRKERYRRIDAHINSR